MTAYITLQRPAYTSGLLRRVTVRVDDHDVAKLRPGQQVQVPVSEGRHTVTARLDWVRSRPLIVTVTEQEEVLIEVRTPLWSGLLYSIIKPSRAIRLDLLERD